MGGRDKGIVGEFGSDMHTLLYLKQITNKPGVLQSMGSESDATERLTELTESTRIYCTTQGTLLNITWHPR